jgi:hypothetical protein
MALRPRRVLEAFVGTTGRMPWPPRTSAIRPPLPDRPFGIRPRDECARAFTAENEKRHSGSHLLAIPDVPREARERRGGIS